MAATEDKIRTKLDADIAAAQAAVAEAQVRCDAADANYAVAAAAERKAWGPPAKEPTGKKLDAWKEANHTLERAISARFGAVDTYRVRKARLAKLQAPGEYDERATKAAAAQERFVQLRGGGTSGGGQRAPRAPKLNPPGSDVYIAAMAQHRPEWELYVAGQAAKDDAAKAAHRDGYQAYRKAYNGLLKLRKEHAAAVASMAAVASNG